MSDIPNPFAALDMFGPRLKEKPKKSKLSPFKKLLPKNWQKNYSVKSLPLKLATNSLQ
jgi:hypothetical protein